LTITGVYGVISKKIELFIVTVVRNQIQHRVFENGVLKKIQGPRSEEVTGG
jgi:hypothetical protein